MVSVYPDIPIGMQFQRESGDSGQRRSQQGHERETAGPATSGAEAGVPQGEKFNYTEATVEAAHNLAATGQGAPRTWPDMIL